MFGDGTTKTRHMSDVITPPSTPSIDASDVTLNGVEFVDSYIP